MFLGLEDAPVSQTPITQEAIALLLDLAERGEIDPWNVDVIDVVDRFLSQLHRDDRRELQESGQALLYGAMLVHLKPVPSSQPQPQRHPLTIPPLQTLT